MAIYTLKQRIFIVKKFYQSGNSKENVQKEFPMVFKEFQSLPSDNCIIELVNLFEEYGNVMKSTDEIDIKNELNEQKNMSVNNDIHNSIEPFEFNFGIKRTRTIIEKSYEDDEITSDIKDEDEEADFSDEYDQHSNTEQKILHFDINTKESENYSSKLKLSLKCEFCDKTFNRRARYDRHINGHNNTCEVCGKRVRDLKVHMRRHTGEKSYQCSQCGVQFHRYDRLRCHMVSHSDERPFPCETCSKAFKTRKHLQEHAKTHLSAEERPIKCEVCGKGFLYNVDLKKHSRIHTGEKPSLCIICGKSFASNEILKVHKRIHTGEKPYQCPYCDEKFSRFGSLHTHKRIHIGEKPYKCNYCEKTFYDSGSRRSHEHVHIGDFPYKCLQCDKAYNHLSSLKSHMSSHRDS